MIRGIGPVYAKKLVRAFGETVFEVIQQEPSRLREVTGIGPKRAERIIAGWAEQKVIREIMLFLHSNGVGTSRAVRIYKTYGADAVRLISENPYRLARDIRGIGFRTADQIAAKLGIEKTALIRVRAGISYALAEAMDEGHCGLPVEELVALTEKLLEVPAELVETALNLELEGGAVVADDLEGRRCVFLAALYRAEREIAEKLKTLAAGKPPWPAIDVDKAIPWVEQRTKLALADSQKAALRVALVSNVTVITGGPGVGKTTLVNSLLKILIAKAVTIALCAPTGRAAKRLSESTGLEAKTIHRLLETDPRTGTFRRNEDEPLDCDLLVVDETSMVDVPLMRAVLRALPEGAALLLVGDVDQLPSVGPGAGSRRHHRVGCGAGRALDRGLPAGRREPDHRQRAPDQPGPDARSRPCRRRRLLFRRCGGRGRGCAEAAGDRAGPDPQAFRARPDTRHPGALPDEPRRPRCSLAQYRAAEGAEPAGRDPHRALRLDILPGRQGHAGRERLRQGRLQRRSRRRVAHRHGGRRARVDFDGREVTYGFGELDELVLAYATTIHKSQGSEYPAVVIPLTTQHYPMLQRNLVYTGVTRGKRLVVLVGQRKALAIAVKGAERGGGGRSCGSGLSRRSSLTCRMIP